MTPESSTRKELRQGHPVYNTLGILAWTTEQKRQLFYETYRSGKGRPRFRPVGRLDGAPTNITLYSYKQG